MCACDHCFFSPLLVRHRNSRSWSWHLEGWEDHSVIEMVHLGRLEGLVCWFQVSKHSVQIERQTLSHNTIIRNASSRKVLWLKWNVGFSTKPTHLAHIHVWGFSITLDMGEIQTFTDTQNKAPFPKTTTRFAWPAITPESADANRMSN